jgi:hypothetical protein
LGKQIDTQRKRGNTIYEEGEAMEALFHAVSTHRKLFLASPLWLAAILVVLSYVGGPDVQRVLHFMAPFSVR